MEKLSERSAMENRMPLINIIVPIYNVEKYLDKCVRSILNQTYKNIRVILVDDGSPDKCPEMCESYARKDDRIFVIHKKNGGLSSARNSGLDVLFSSQFSDKGKYVAFIDSDDYVAEDYIEFLYDMIEKNQADIAQCGHYIEFSEKRRNDKNREHKTIVLSKEEGLESLCYNGVWDVTAWNKLYKLQILEYVRYPEGRCYEDTATSYLITDKAKRLVVNMEPKYYYVQRYSSIANSNSWKEYKIQFIEIGDQFADWITLNYPQYAEAANIKRVFVRFSTLSQMVNSNHYDDRVVEIRKTILNYKDSVLKNPKVNNRDKMGMIALSCGWNFYRILWKTYYKFVRRR